MTNKKFSVWEVPPLREGVTITTVPNLTGVESKEHSCLCIDDSEHNVEVPRSVLNLVSLMQDYNLTWDRVYTILLEEVSDGKNGFSYVPNVLLERILHEFNGLNGLYASDNKEMLQPFRLDYTELIKLMEGVIEDDE